MKARTIRPAFWERLASGIEGDVASDLFERGRYATDASPYRCFPAGVIRPKSAADAGIALDLCAEQGLAVIPRGGGTSTAGQSLGEGAVLDFSRYCNRVTSIDADQLSCTVEPGVTTAALNAALRPHGLAFPIGAPLQHQATIGGMLGNNASGIRSLRYGRMRDNVLSVDAWLAGGEPVRFSPVVEENASAPGRDRLLSLLAFGEVHEAELRAGLAGAMPDGYDFASLMPSENAQNPARLLAGSEGTLAVATSIELRCVRRPPNRALGICRFSSLGAALGSVAKIVALGASAVELFDAPLIGVLARRSANDGQASRLLQGDPAALLIVEFDQENAVENTRLLKALDDLAADSGQKRFNVMEVMGENQQRAVWRFRRDVLSRALALKTGGAPAVFLEDGTVPLERLASFAAELGAAFETHGVNVSFYGNAGKGTLHVQPIAGLGNGDPELLRKVGDSVTAILKAHGGRLTSGYGLGLMRGEAAERLRGIPLSRLHRELKSILDPRGLLNPGKIVAPPDFADPFLLRRATGTTGAACTGLSLCRTKETRLSCPSYLLTGEERDSPRGRANSVALALTGELGGNAMASEAMRDTMRLCVSCKACKSACPLGIDIPKMKAETRAAAALTSLLPRSERLIARLPEYSGRATAWRHALALRDAIPGFSRLSERWLGLAADRPWPRWSGRPFKLPLETTARPNGTVALFADTFNRSFEPSNLRAAANVLEAAGYAAVAFIDDNPGPLCCGRTFYDAGDFETAKTYAVRFTSALENYRARNIPVVGLEPNCVLMVRDEYRAFGSTPEDGPPAVLFEEFVSEKAKAGAFEVHLNAVEADLIFHSHCHERASGVEQAAHAMLALVPGLKVTSTPPLCCGLNGPVGMTADTFEASLGIAELALFPAIRKLDRDALVAATGFSCRKQVRDGLGRIARHPAAVLDLALRSHGGLGG